MLIALWSPKGGSGTSVLAAACAVVLARAAGAARLADLAGDQPAVLGIGTDPATGLRDWLAMGPGAPIEALDRLAIEVGSGLELIPAGRGPSVLSPMASAEAGAALAVGLRGASVPVVVDAGRAEAPAHRAVVEIADVSVAVIRGCYLALRRLVRSPMIETSNGIALVREQGRALGAREVAAVTDRAVLARVDVREDIARAVDAGVLPHRMPDALTRAAMELLEGVGCTAHRKGRVA